MDRRLMKSLLAAACAIPLVIVTTAPAQAQSHAVTRPTNEVVLSIGRGQLITLPGRIADLFIVDDAIADVEVKSERQLYVFGKKGGETTIYASDAGGNVIWSAVLRVGSNIESVDQMMALAMPDAKVAVSSIGSGTFLLTGTVASPEDAAEAQRLVSAYTGSTNIITRLKTATPLQVNLQVRFAEVSRSLVREISSNIQTRDTSGGFVFGLGRGRPVGTIGINGQTVSGIDTTGMPIVDASGIYGLPSGTLNYPFDPVSGKFVIPGTGYTFNRNTVGQSVLNLAGHLFGLDVATAFDLAERVGLVTTLSQPNLTALSGETADFLAGGEFPIPSAQGLGSTSIEYKKYGVSLSYTPTVLANGRISLRVRPEVSELTAQGSVTLNGFRVPGLTVRRAETTVELGSGQSFMIAGLMSSNSQNTIDKIPGAGDLPILGSLFRSTSYQRGETELVIIVTPYLVNPVDAKDIKMPTDGYEAPNELQRILGNIENNGKTGSTRPLPSAKPADTPDPAVGALDPALPAPAPAPAAATAPHESRNERKASHRATAAANTAAPGFNLD